MQGNQHKVLVYSCSGASSAAQMANWIAVRLDRMGLAEMSCIAGIGGGVKALIHKGRSADVMIVIDGCPLKCAEACLTKEDFKGFIHYDLSAMGVAKKLHEDFDPAQAQRILEAIVRNLKDKHLNGSSSISKGEV